MEINKIAGYCSIILGLIFIIFPMFSAELVSVIVGFSLLFFGISTAFLGWNMHNEVENAFPIIILAIGIIAIITGFIFLFYIDALSFLVGIQFYIVGFIMVVFGIAGLFTRRTTISTFSSLLVLLMGIIAIALAASAVNQPVFIAIIVGVVLIIEGVVLLLTY